LLAQGDKLKPEVMLRAEEAGEPPEGIQGKPKLGRKFTSTGDHSQKGSVAELTELMTRLILTTQCASTAQIASG